MMRWSGVGIYHTSLVIDDRLESYYGFAQYGVTGIDTPERIDHLPSSMGTSKYYKTIELGESPRDYESCHEIYMQFRQNEEWLSDHYNFVLHNCNDYTTTLAKALLCVDQIPQYPKWVRRIEKMARFIYGVSLDHLLGFMKKFPPLGQPYSQPKRVSEQNASIVTDSPDLI